MVQVSARKMEELFNTIAKQNESLLELRNEMVVLVDNRIPVEEFADKINVGHTVLDYMIAGTHRSKFTLKVFKKRGTKQRFTLRSEVDRYFEGFGK